MTIMQSAELKKKEADMPILKPHNLSVQCVGVGAHRAPSASKVWCGGSLWELTPHCQPDSTLTKSDTRVPPTQRRARLRKTTLHVRWVLSDQPEESVHRTH